jgi:glycosyltransferase involved in cell wall biosynthesis
MKIIHVISSLSKGGAERVAIELANQAKRSGDEVVIIAGWPENPEYLQSQIDPNVNVKFVANKKSVAYLKILYWVLINRKWISRYDVLHCHLTFGAIFGSIAHIILKKILRNKKTIIIETNHAVGMAIPKFNRWLQSCMSLQRDGLALMAKDSYWTNFILKHPRLKTAIIPNGISMPPHQKSNELKQIFRKEKGIPDNCKYLVGTVGMLRPDRKPWLYIPIFKAIYEVWGDEVYFILAGGGIEFDKIKMLIEDQGLSGHVYMPGLVNNSAALISNMDVYVSVSVGNTGGISMLEAAICNVPVVSIQLTENYETKKDDWFWSHTDINEVAKKIIFLLQNTDERNELSVNQNKYVNKYFTTKAMDASYKSFYNSILTH